MQEFRLPDPGEGLTEAEIVAWRVKPGDMVHVNDVLLEVETAKSLVELPSPFEGTVEALLVEEGQTVEVGSPIIRVTSGDADAVETAADTADTVHKEEDGDGAVLVGYGVRGGAETRRKKPRTVQSVPAASAHPVVAKPPTRKLAKDLGVDLAAVIGSGLAGEVTRDDVVQAAKQAKVFRNLQAPEWAGGREERIPVKGVRKVIAQGMVDSAFTAPHVSVFTDVDATRTMEFVQRLKASTDFEGVRISPLLIMAKAIIWAIRRNPQVNSTFTGDELVVHHYVNLGIAAATPRGLLVPNVKDAQDMTLLELATALQQLTATAREGRTQPADMQHGTITITNIGVFGMDSGTPILNPGETGIIALGTIRQKPWVVDGEVRPRWVTTVGGSFDHRAIDGDVISRFVADVASILEEPALLLD
ncbi:dihydrolipoamide acetyltransferase family protein [Agrococcus sp. KRD186]|uniref:dihydrolipoamide acetyltransferase family protein n=1 Tax=Agrococcus sp. KRD186 TaxID=2729730 RepID=UPI0019D271BB|nr:dihydrolipoamide acetyltransferase family protein [Agrococcus sp. KRD186]